MAVNPTVQSVTGNDNTFKTVLLSGFRAPAHPGYVSGRYYAGLDCPFSLAVGLNSSTLLLSLFYVYFAVAPTQIGIGVSATGLGSSVKCGLWGTSNVTKRPSGLMIPGSGSNTATDTSAGTGFKGNTANITLLPGVPYWFGCAFTGTAPTCTTIGGSNTAVDALIGKNSPESAAILGFTTPFTFANDITQLDLTNATFTQSGAAGIPVGFIQAP